MKKELGPKYNHRAVEEGRYDFWLKGGYFLSGDKTKEPFTIVIPPPNVTGKLHTGHAWDTTLQDIIIRRKRMQGYDALWLPGMDHAGIATQAKVDARLKEEGISRYDIGREKFLERAWQWKDEYANHIHEQWAALGLSLDYSKERFTLDEGLNKAVNTVFINLYNKGLIYQGERIINWDPEAKTALSNIEVEHKETNGAFYYFKYPFVEEDGYILIATTRPETMFADQAIMVHPDDERYKDVVGKKVYIPNTNIQIPVISDSYVDINFGTGAVKVTPAHDPNDFEVGKRHNLAMPLCMNDDGTMNKMALKYEGLDRFICRKMLVEDLKEAGLCTKIEPIVHQVGYSERTHVIVEPRLSKQWFVKMEPLAKQALEKNTVSFVPDRFKKTYNHWMETIQDWCISRQLWWGHRIPAWYKDSEVRVQVESPGLGWHQDEDVLDTWFSSALWPFSTLGWPEETEDLKRYYPTNVLVTGYDIIFFWVSRMIFQAIEFTGKSPFNQVLIHGLVRDSEGRKMSKSLGNGIDPMDIKEKYGTDTLRYFLTTSSAPGQDLRFETEKVLSTWNYINKIWNISRYVIMNLGEEKKYEEYVRIINEGNLNKASNWILTKLNRLIEECDEAYDKFDFGMVAKPLYNFVWDDFASWYIELSKVDLSGDNEDAKNKTRAVLVYVLMNILKLLHPFMPFVTEEIYQSIPHIEESIMISSWPKKNDNLDNLVDLNDINDAILIITSIRNIRANANKPLSKPIKIIIKTTMESNIVIEHTKDYICRFTNPSTFTYGTSVDINFEAVTVILNNLSIFIPSSELIDIKEEKARLKLELAKLEKELARSRGMMNNANFLNKAPKEKILEEKKKLDEYEKKYNGVKERLNELEK